MPAALLAGAPLGSTPTWKSCAPELADLGAPKRSPVRVVDDGRRKAMLRSVSRNLFVGPLTDCFFDPDKALCLRDIERSAADAPIIGRCQPQRCQNSRVGENPSRPGRPASPRSEPICASVTCPLCNVNILPNSETVSKRAVDRSNNSPTDNNDGGRP